MTHVVKFVKFDLLREWIEMTWDLIVWLMSRDSCCMSNYRADLWEILHCNTLKHTATNLITRLSTFLDTEARLEMMSQALSSSPLYYTRGWLSVDLTCKRGSVGQSKGLLIPRSSVRFRLNPDNLNLHGFELHTHPIEGAKLLLKVLKAIIIISKWTRDDD